MEENNTIETMPEAERLLSLVEAGERLALSVWTLRQWAYAGKIASCKLGSRLLIPESEIRRMIDESLRPAKPKVKPINLKAEKHKQKEIVIAIERLDRRIGIIEKRIGRLARLKIEQAAIYASTVEQLEQLKAEKTELLKRSEWPSV